MRQVVPPSPSPRSKAYGGAALCALAALALGAFRLGDKGFWVDEAVSASFALSPLEAWWVDANMALYYALLSGWMQAFGSSESELRSLSVVAFAASGFVFHLLARELLGARAAWIASLLYLSNAFVVRFAQEARGYMLAVLLVLIGTLAFVRVRQRAQLRWALLFGLSMGLAMYAHLFALWVAVAHAAVALGHAVRNPPARRAWLVAHALCGALAAPALLHALHKGAGQVAWIYPPSLASVGRSFVAWSGGSVALALLEAALFIGFTLSTARRLRARPAPHDDGPAWLVLSWFLVPVGLVLVLSVAVTPLALPKYFLVIVPSWLLGCAAALDRLRSGALRAVLLAVVSLLSTERLHVWYFEYEQERWRELVTLLDQQLRPGDALALELGSPEAFEYYVWRRGLAARWPAPLPPAGRFGFPIADRPDPDAGTRLARARTADRVFLVRNRVPAGPLATAIARSHQLRWSRELAPIDDDARSVFSDASGRIITLQLFERAP